MLFSSIPFLAFFAPLFLLFYLLCPWRNLVFLFFNLVFYFWGENYFIGVLLASITINYLSGVCIGRSSTILWRKVFLAIGITLNCCLFFYYKYFTFFLTEVLPGLSSFTPPADFQPVHLPLGISFFTFQGLSYLVDVYRKDAEHCQSWFDLALYTSMFPQLIAGPIVRFHNVAKAIVKRHVTFGRVRFGIRLFVIGLAQKTLIANTLGFAVDNIYAYDPVNLGALVAWAGVTSYTLQIFFDFCGYTNMAIGMGVMLGFRFPRNFRYPYISQSLTEFWRRWHISLSTWFRDYLYIPLGGNRKGTLRTVINLLIVFLLCGIWHGAAYTFLVWGLFHGAFLMLERVGLRKLLAQLPRPLRHIYALSVIMVGWTFFRADSLPEAFAMLKAMAGMNTNVTVSELASVLSNEQLVAFIIGVVFSTPLIDRLSRIAWSSFALRLQGPLFSYAQSSLRLAVFGAIFFLSYIYLLAGTYNPFLYFRF